MGIIARTLTKGFRTSFFRNQPVHQFYGHLQAVLREIAPGGELDNFFARPENVIDGQTQPGEIEWSTALEGEQTMFKDLPAERQQAVADQIGRSLDRIRKYAEEKQSRTGKEKDYAEYLKSVAVSPDMNQIFIVKNQPVLVHWGFINEDGNHPGKGIYAGWDDFIAEIHRKAGKKTAEQPQPQQVVLPPEPPPYSESQPVKEPEKTAAAAAVATAATPAKAAEPAKPPAAKKPEAPPAPEEKEKRVMACGLGAYRWVKWLAIILAIIILLLLLLRFVPPPQSAFPQLPPGIGGMGGSGGGGGLGDLSDLLGGGGGGGGGGLPGLGKGNGAPGGNKGGQVPAPGSTCPTCGHHVPESGGQSTGHNQGGSNSGHNNEQGQTAPAPAGTPAPGGPPAAEAVKPGDAK